MPKRALYERRPFLLASILASTAYFLLRDANFPEIFAVLLKAGSVALLAAYAFLRHEHPDARLLVWVLGLGALGDAAIEYDFQIGGLLFFAGHLIAMALYLRNRREALSPSQKGAVAALLLGTPVIAWLLPADRAMATQVALYALALGGMAASAWGSTFPRYRVGAGAVLFVISDLLIFARLGPLANSGLPYLLIWPTYYIGQFLICTGVIQSLRKHRPELRVVPDR